jgi:E3 ubiquitin-protein ligase HECTD2
MFIHDPDSNLCWFNPASHDLDEFYLVGVVVGLACYNAATLDVPLPQVCLDPDNDRERSLTERT